MTGERIAQSLTTFSARAKSYDCESSWVRDEQLIDPLLQGIERGAIVVDVCSGTGAVGRRAAAMGADVIAVDLSLSMLSENPSSMKLRASGSQLPLRDGVASRVTCRQGLHYLDVTAAVAEFARVSSRSIALGSIVMLDRSHEDFWRAYFDIASPGRLHIFSPGDLRDLLERAGLRVDSQQTIVDRGGLLGPIRHLGDAAVAAVRRHFTSSTVAQDYGVEPADDDLTYLQRWEFVVASRASA